MTDRETFIFEYLKAHIGGVDVLNADLVDAYIEKFKPSFTPTSYGAFKCPSLGRLLGSMYRKGLLERSRAGLPGVGMGFPTWVYHYVIPYWQRERLRALGQIV